MLDFHSSISGFRGLRMTDFFILATAVFAVIVTVRAVTLHRLRRRDDAGDSEV